MPPSAPANPRCPLWLWPNLLSLDAPLLAVLWQELLAFHHAIPLRPAGRATLALTVWAIYLGDRLLDASRPPRYPESTRHLFYRRHFRPAAVLLFVVLLADTLIALLWLRPAVFRNGLIPFAAVAAYLLLVHRRAKPVAKEPLVALLFCIGVFLVPWTNGPSARPSLLLHAAAFFPLCLANVVAIERWEARELRGPSHPSHPVTAVLARAVLPGLLVLAAASFALGLPAIAASAVLSAAVLAAERRLSLDARRVLIDAALLTPILFLL